jgi:hypothetical protein
VLDKLGRSRRVIEALAAHSDAAAVERVIRYCESPFDAALLPPAPIFPFASEPHVEEWRRYAAEAGAAVFSYLGDRLPQLKLPIQAGISRTEAYANVVRRGHPFDRRDFGGTLELAEPAALRLYVHDHPAGALPILTTSCRADFEALCQALGSRSEPDAVGPAVNAQMVAGFINWDRVHRYRDEWVAGGGIDWPAEMQRVAVHEKWRFHDRFIVTCERPYSGVMAAELGIAEGPAAWLEVSTRFRVEHEMTHYATKRLYGAMRLNMLDEAIADFMGMTYALGTFRASWFLRFAGIDGDDEDQPILSPEGRMHTYKEDLEGDALDLLARLMVRAAHGLEQVAARRSDAVARGRLLLALAALTLDDMASSDVLERFDTAHEAAGRAIHAAC